MSVRLPLDDFRAVRMILEPDDFALGPDEPDPPPSDPISQETWRGLTVLPDDAAIRTSDHNGEALADTYRLWSQWIAVTGKEGDALFVPMLDAADDLQTSLFTALYGYYRAAFSSLRNVLELMTVGACGFLSKNSGAFEDWRGGSGNLSFGRAADQLSREPALDAFNTRLRRSCGQSLFDAKDGSRNLPGGYARQWYEVLCGYAHSRPGFTDGDLRHSNGPIYVASVFWDWRRAYVQTVSLCSVLVPLCRPSADREEIAKLFTADPSVAAADLREAFGQP